MNSMMNSWIDQQFWQAYNMYNHPSLVQGQAQQASIYNNPTLAQQGGLGGLGGFPLSMQPKRYMIENQRMNRQEFVDYLYPDDCPEKTFLILKLGGDEE
jgi:hypothetical protein